jgi:hypothetical protein
MSDPVDLDRPTNDRPLGPVTTLPQAVGDHRHVRSVRHLLLGQEAATEEGSHAQEFEEVRCHSVHRHPLGGTAARQVAAQVHDLGIRCGSECLERPGASLVILEIRC